MSGSISQWIQQITPTYAPCALLMTLYVMMALDGSQMQCEITATLRLSACQLVRLVSISTKKNTSMESA